MYLDNVQRYKASQAAGQPLRDSRPSPLLVDLLAKQRVGVQPTTGMMAQARLEGRASGMDAGEEVRVHAVGTG